MRPAHPLDLYAELRDLVDALNRALFTPVLPTAMLLVRGRRRPAGAEQPVCWGQWRQVPWGPYPALTLNTEALAQDSDAALLGALVHEMVHLWQAQPGHVRPLEGHHNREWARQMLLLGLMPSDTGVPGGRTTGRHMSQFLVPRGRVHGLAVRWQAAQRPLLSWHLMPLLDLLSVTPRRAGGPTRHRLTCPTCTAQAWAHCGTRLLCGTCQTRLQRPEAG